MVTSKHKMLFLLPVAFSLLKKKRRYFMFVASATDAAMFYRYNKNSP